MPEPPVPDTPLTDAVALALRRGRHRLGLSQRDLAHRAGLASGTVGRLETGSRAPLVAVNAALAAVGLRLAVVTAAGRPWQRDEALAMDLDEMRDAGGRRLPAHLRTCDPPSPEPWWRYCRRRERPENVLGDLPGPDDRPTFVYPARAAFQDAMQAWQERIDESGPR